jgi:membrane protease YdiL (CAAX protease family)
MTSINHRRDLFTILIAALIILLIRKLPFISDTLELIPLFGKSIPFFLLTVYILFITFKRYGSLEQLGLKPNIPFITIFYWGIGAAFIRLLAGEGLSYIFNLFGSSPDVSFVSPIKGDFTTFLISLPFMWLIAGLGEEVLHRGFIMRKIAIIWGDANKAWMRALVVHALIFGIGHFYQGISGVIITTLSGIIYGAAYYFSGKNLWVSIIAHSFANTIAFFEIYNG